MVLDDFTMFNSICNFSANETVRVCMQKDLITYRIGLSCYKVIQHRNRLIQSNSSMPTKLSIWASPTVFSSNYFDQCTCTKCILNVVTVYCIQLHIQLILWQLVPYTYHPALQFLFKYFPTQPKSTPSSFGLSYLMKTTVTIHLIYTHYEFMLLYHHEAQRQQVTY